MSTLGYRQLVSSGGVDENVTKDREADAAQARYYRQELSALRARVESDLARRYIEMLQLTDSGLLSRAADVRQSIRTLEYEVATVERLGQGLKRWL